MFGTGKEFSAKGVEFSGQVIELYTTTFGKWAYFVIAVSAFSIMFGTCVAVFDGYSRAMSSTIRLMQGKKEQSDSDEKIKMLYRIVLMIVSVGSFVLIWIFNDNPNGF